MRTKFFLLFILFISKISLAQINKGAILLEGSGGFSINKTVNDQVSSSYKLESRNSSANLGSQIAFFTSETFSLGVGISYAFSKSKTTQDGSKTESTYTMMSLTTSATKYINLTDKLYFTGALTLSGGAGVTRNEPYETTYYMYQIRTNVAPGLAYFVSNRWMITTTMGSLYANYNWRKLEEFEDNKYNEFNGGLSFQLNTFSIGVRYLLRNSEE